MWAGLWGLRVLPGVRPASSAVTVLPMITAPAARSMATALASRAGVRPACSTVPFSVGMSAVSKMSLMPTGTPWRGPIRPPLAAPRVGGPRLGERVLGIEEGPRLDPCVDGAHAGQARLDRLPPN